MSKKDKSIKFIKRFLLYGSLIAVLIFISIISYYYITLYTAGDSHEGELALVNATVLSGESLETEEDMTVVIRDGVITEVVANEEVQISGDTEILDISGHTVMPGLIDMHVHLGMPDSDFEEMGVFGTSMFMFDYIQYFPDKRSDFLDYGVTTIRSAGDDPYWMMDLRERINDTRLEGPRVFASALFTTETGHPISTAGAAPDSVYYPGTPEAAKEQVQAFAAGDDRVDFIKVIQESGIEEYPLDSIDYDVLEAIVTEAHVHELPVFGHWNRWSDLEELLNANVDGLEHVGRDAISEGWQTEIFDQMTEQGVTMTPTLMVSIFEIEDAKANMQDRVKEFHDAGGEILLGTDTGMPDIMPGSSVHTELINLVDSGLSPTEALQAATSNAANALRDDSIGVIAPEKAADLIIMEGNPSQSIEDIKNIKKVFRDGRLVVENE